MQTLLSLLEQYGLAFVFLNVLAAQAGLPMPAVPTLIITGALIGKGHSFPALLAAASAAALLADIAWYLAGKRYGRRVLTTICRVSLSPDSCIRQTENIYVRWGPKSLLLAKFIPGFASVATTLAGVVRTRFPLFLLCNTLGALLWAGTAIFVGYLFRDAVADVLDVLAAMGRIGVVIVLLGLVLFVLNKWWQRQRLIRQLKMDRISVAELNALLDAGDAPVILDVRPEAARQSGYIPGALPVSMEAPTAPLANISRHHDVIIYCACPNEISAARIAKMLMQHGFTRVRPLAGGIDAWREAGYLLIADEMDGETAEVVHG